MGFSDPGATLQRVPGGAPVLQMPDELADLRILVVDDADANRILMERILRRSGHRAIVTSPDGEDAVRRWTTEGCDLMLLDLSMPGLSGFDVLRRVAPLVDVVPVIVLTADATAQARVQALELGARDFLTKPFDRSEVVLRVRNHLHARLLQRRLEATVGEVRLELLQRLALAAELRDDDTHEHTERVGAMSRAIARQLGLHSGEADLIAAAAPLHDVGKIGTPDTILLKPGRLDPDERVIMQQHVEVGARILTGSSSPVLAAAEAIAWTHHERWDGSGYPRGLTGEEIPLAGRIVAIADVFDALVNERPYKRAWPVADALAEMASQSDKHFCPVVLAAFLELDHAALLAGRPGTGPTPSVDFVATTDGPVSAA